MTCREKVYDDLSVRTYLNRNAVHEERRYGMPLDQIVEIGAQLRI
jgi:hypothetical protein